MENLQKKKNQEKEIINLLTGTTFHELKNYLKLMK